MRAFPLYLGFIATGIGVALPGALLPTLLVRWHLGDAQAGQLFFAAWIGSSIGSLLVRGSLRTILLAGSVLIAGAAAGIALCGGHAADAWLALYGLGLGMVMTATSLIRQQQVAQSGGRTGTELVRLNLMWAAGACACPALTERALLHGSMRPLLLGLALFFSLLAVWAAMQSDLLRATEAAKSPSWSALKRTPPGLICMIFLITGIEAATGGWLATYARRGGDTVAASVAALTCFWAGLLLSRLFWSVCDRWLTHDRVVRASLVLMALASALLVVSGQGSSLAVGAFLLGFGIGPAYPLLLAWALRFQRGTTMFFLAGVGSACLPWLMGVLSSRAGSLRIGFVVPMTGTFVMLALSLLLPLGLWSREDRSQDVDQVA